jgi:signal transduction histidine kinase
VIRRVSFRLALASSVVATVGLWAYTGVVFVDRLDSLERQSAEISSRYTRAQELLTTVRTQVLVASVRVRDGLLNRDKAFVAECRAQIQVGYDAINAALSAYAPLAATGDDIVGRLRTEVDGFRDVAFDALSARPTLSPPEIRELLNAHVVPRREALFRISEDVQALNRAAFLRQQSDVTRIYRSAEAQAWQRLGVALAGSLVAVIATWIYAQRFERGLRAEIGRSAQLSRELQDATMKLIHAQEAERRAIARELHDEIGQVLTAVKVDLGLAQRDVQAHGLWVESLAAAQDSTVGAIHAVRDLTQLLHPPALDDLGLVAGIEAMLRSVSRQQQVVVRFTHSGLDDRLPQQVERAAYRIVQEALTNVLRHARASTCRVALRRALDVLTIDVEDDGVGFDTVDGHPQQAGIGLIGIRERVTELGGRYHVDSRNPVGTRLHVELPSPRSHRTGGHAVA